MSEHHIDDDEEEALENALFTETAAADATDITDSPSRDLPVDVTNMGDGALVSEQPSASQDAFLEACQETDIPAAICRAQLQLLPLLVYISPSSLVPIDAQDVKKRAAERAHHYNMSHVFDSARVTALRHDRCVSLHLAAGSPPALQFAAFVPVLDLPACFVIDPRMGSVLFSKAGVLNADLVTEWLENSCPLPPAAASTLTVATPTSHTPHTAPSSSASEAHSASPASSNSSASEAHSASPASSNRSTSHTTSSSVPRRPQTPPAPVQTAAQFADSLRELGRKRTHAKSPVSKQKTATSSPSISNGPPAPSASPQQRLSPVDPPSSSVRRHPKHKRSVAGSTSTDPPSAAATATISFRLSNGESAVRTFAATATLEEVCEFLETETGVRKPYRLMTSFPKHLFTREEYPMRLMDLNLVPRTSLIVSSYIEKGSSEAELLAVGTSAEANAAQAQNQASSSYLGSVRDTLYGWMGWN